ncbi:NAD(P)-binding domain-containing protein [Flavobacterium sp. KACC 22761]|uniref:NAD(P)-binding domain-containing protein n=1 Tax=Flavobacterium sp. KACC 22761 TaxID=3092665 RepID=UPI002A74F0F3|nr:NAD(P)-binding domain-containing protein [Flavobacterium sp. KACC 22761]WPO78241.1 NAD(P)-binding domain-containing protein [Flavobacterium sp. KACC 22761]
MKIGIIGVSSVTMKLADRAAKAGHEVLISHVRNNNIIKESVMRMGNKVKLVSKERVLKAGIIILFVPLDDLKNFISDLPDMSGKILIHTNNGIIGKEFPKFALGKSSSEILILQLPEANIIKTYNIIEPSVCLQKKQNYVGDKIFYSGDNIIAKSRVKSFFKTLDFESVDFDV